MEYSYSIIIPHKNIPELLQRCLDSIPKRDDVQIIIVDDNSDPEIVDFDHFPGLGCPNTEVYFDKSGKGAGRARNIGLEHAKGEWVLFADADDFFNYCISDFLDNYKTNDSDIIFCNASSLDSEKYTSTDRCSLANDITKIYSINCEEGEFLFRYMQGVPWSKMIKLSLVKDNNIHFDETPIANDVTFSYLTGFKAKKVLVDDRAVYCVTMRNESITYSCMTTEKRLAIIEIFARKYKYLLEHGIDMFQNQIPYHMLCLKEENILAYNSGMEIISSYGFDKAILKKKPYIIRYNDTFINSILFLKLSISYKNKAKIIDIINGIYLIFDLKNTIYAFFSKKQRNKKHKA